MRHQYQSFPPYSLRHAYNLEQLDFKDPVILFQPPDVPPEANKIASHVLYNLKPNNDLSLKLEARIAPH